MGMTPERWSQVDAAFQAVVDRPSVERSELLDRLCGADHELRQEVEGLLAADEESQGFLEPPPPSGERAPGGALPPAPRVGPYRVLEKIGEGGMSSVYVAAREDQAYEKRVAVKFFRPELESPALVQRFHVERQILANLDHPYIARLLDGSSTADGVPYLIMDYVEGQPIDEYCDTRRLSVEARLELFRKVCTAVQYAHANLVVHRDVKPSNILVRGDGEPKLLDFGIAKLLSPGVGPVRHEPTRLGAYVMTPEYASPEQARGEPVTTAADVYSLGVLLYRLLTGTLPYDVENRPLPEILRAVCEEEPARPSARAGALDAEVAGARGTTPRALARRLAGDLDTIVLKALRKEPERRYASVEQMSEDVRRHLAGLPVMARPDTLAYRTAKFARRHRLGVAMAMVAALGAAAFVGMLVVQSIRLRKALGRAEAVTRFLRETLGSANPYGGIGRDVTLVEVLQRSVGRIDASLAGEPETDATVRATLGVTFRDLGRYSEAQPLLEQALAIRRRLLGSAHPAVAESLMDLGELLNQTTDLTRAESLFREAVAIERSTFGADGLETAEALNGLGSVLRKQGDYAQAEAVNREALGIRQRRLPADHAKVAQSLRMLGAVLHDRGDYKAAEPFVKQALEIVRRTLPADSAEITLALRDYAVLLTDEGDFAAAEPLFREVLARQRERLGEEHSIIAESLTNVARVATERGNVREAADLQRQALGIFVKLLGEDNIYVARSAMNLGIMLTQLDELGPAREHLEKSLAISRKAWGPVHQHTAIVLENLGYLSTVEGNYAQAELHFKEAWDIMRSTVGETHPESVNSLTSLAYAVWEQGRRKEAVALLEQALGFYASMKSPNPFYLAVCQSQYGAFLTELGRYEEARNVLTAAYRTFLATAGRESGQTKEAAERLSGLAKAWHNPAFDEALRELLGH